MVKNVCFQCFVHIAQLCTHQCPCNLNNRLKNNRTKQEVKLGGAGVNGVTGNHQNICYCLKLL